MEQTTMFDPLYPWDPAYFQFSLAKFRDQCGDWSTFTPWATALNRALDGGQCRVTSLSIVGLSFSVETFPLLSCALVFPTNSIQVLELSRNIREVDGVNASLDLGTIQELCTALVSKHCGCQGAVHHQEPALRRGTGGALHSDEARERQSADAQLAAQSSDLYGRARAVRPFGAQALRARGHLPGLEPDRGRGGAAPGGTKQRPQFHN
jgi:hypothetical protein